MVRERPRGFNASMGHPRVLTAEKHGVDVHSAIVSMPQWAIPAFFPRECEVAGILGDEVSMPQWAIPAFLPKNIEAGGYTTCVFQCLNGPSPRSDDLPDSKPKYT